MFAHRADLSAAGYAEIVALCARGYEEPFDEIMALVADATYVIATRDGQLVSHPVPRTLFTFNRALRWGYIERDFLGAIRVGAVGSSTACAKHGRQRPAAMSPSGRASLS